MRVDAEFAAMVPPLSADEFAGLEADILRDGRATVPLVVWGDTLVDGHNRFDICTRHGLAYTTMPAPDWVQDRRDAAIWIRSNALNRRNLGPITRAMLASGNEEDIRAKAEARERAGVRADPMTNLSQGTSRDAVAALAGMAHGTYTAAKVVGTQATPALRAAVDRGDIAVSTGAELTALPHETQTRIAEAGGRAAREAVKAIRQDAAERKHAEYADAQARIAVGLPTRATIRKCSWSDLLSEYPDGSIDLIVTDPPYSTDLEDVEQFSAWVQTAFDKLAPTGRAYICIGAYPDELEVYLRRTREAGFRGRTQVLVWTYRNTMGPSPTYDYAQNWQAIIYVWGPDAPPLVCPSLIEHFAVQDISAPCGSAGQRYHAWQKPDDLADRIVRHASKPGDIVVDPFAGTGTFLLAAARAGRNAVGCDVDDRMLQIATDRGCVMEPEHGR